jgi:hypothetical protein
VKTGGKYWEHDNDIPLHGKASLGQYDTWAATGQAQETARLKACLEKGDCPDKNWEHNLNVPLQGSRSNLAEYDTWVARDDSKETSKI